MDSIINNINKDFENRIRLGIMSILMVNDQVDFIHLRNLLQVTDGNLASHISALEKIGYLESKKRFIGKKPNTQYSATKEGKDAFNEHLQALEFLLKTHNHT